MDFILTFEYSGSYDEYTWKPCWSGLASFFILILSIIFSVIHTIGYVHKRSRCSRQVHENHELVSRNRNYGRLSIGRIYEIHPRNELDTIVILWNTIPTFQNGIEYNICLWHSPNILYDCITHGDTQTRSIVKINRTIDQIIPVNEKENLACFCDGSYSHRGRIGCGGFRTSNGFGKTRFISPNKPRNGSTAAEVLAAFLAIQYALKGHYQKLTIYTDNSKVEQLVKRPKQKDSFEYSDICQILSEYYRENGENSIEVIRVHGHPTVDEQRKCPIKAQFAKVDRKVRKKNRQYMKRRQTIHFEWNYYYYYRHQPTPYLYYTYTIFGYDI